MCIYTPLIALLCSNFLLLSMDLSGQEDHLVFRKAYFLEEFIPLDQVDQEFDSYESFSEIAHSSQKDYFDRIMNQNKDYFYFPTDAENEDSEINYEEFRKIYNPKYTSKNDENYSENKFKIKIKKTKPNKIKRAKRKSFEKNKKLLETLIWRIYQKNYADSMLKPKDIIIAIALDLKKELPEKIVFFKTVVEILSKKNPSLFRLKRKKLRRLITEWNKVRNQFSSKNYRKENKRQAKLKIIQKTIKLFNKLINKYRIEVNDEHSLKSLSEIISKQISQEINNHRSLSRKDKVFSYIVNYLENQ